MTNAQAALQAAATSLSSKWWDKKDVIRRAEEFKTWLDAQDNLDRTKTYIGATRTYGEV